MKIISIVFHSGAGHTKKMAEAVHKGVSSVNGIKSYLLEIKGDHIDKGRFQNENLMKTLDQSDAIIFGSPTYMGNVSGQFKAFADATGERWMKRAWVDKVAAGFTVSGSPSGDKLNTLNYFHILAAQHGMISIGQNIVGYGDKLGRNNLGSYMGVMGQGGMQPDDGSPSPGDLATGEALGVRVAEFILKIKANEPVSVR
jgi:NAD(P)H dehydrogenase (quinone)